MAKAYKFVKMQFTAFGIILLATPAFARSFSIKDAGISLWIFIIVGAVIVLLQLVPATILFFSLVGTASAAVFGRKTVEKKEVEEGGELAFGGSVPARIEK